VPEAGSPAARRAAERSFTRAEVMREPSFWLLTVSGALFGMGLVGLQANWLVYFQDIGFSAQSAALSATAFGVGSFSARFLWGALATRWSPRRLMTVATAITAATVLFMFPVNSVAAMLAVSLANGLALGGNLVMRPLINANYFGRNHLGAITGVMRPFMVVATATGPVLVAGLYDLTTSWYVAFGFVVVIWAASALTVAVAAPPKQQVTEASTAG
jgi:MFS family permease